MHYIDWLLVIIPVTLVTYIGFKTQKYVKGVADFLTAGRVAGRYVLSVASGEAAMGLVSMIALFEMYYNTAFSLNFWNTMTIPVGMFMALTGFCVYRFRETRAMTLGQFLEIRYSKSFRVFAAILQSIAGVVNYAIFPAVGARCLIYFCDLPILFKIGSFEIPTFILLMACFLSLAVLIVTLGGQVTIMVTDCVQGLLGYPIYLILLGYLLYRFSWNNDIIPTLLTRPAGQSMINPYEISHLRDFNFLYVIIGIIGMFFTRIAWSGAQGYAAAAENPHEQKMGGVLGTWRGILSMMVFLFLTIAAFTYINKPGLNQESLAVKKELSSKTLVDINKWTPNAYQVPEHIINSNNPAEDIYQSLLVNDREKAQSFKTIYGQMLVPTTIKHILPVGLTGLFCALMLFMLISTDTTYIHSWGSVIVQDLILPLRKKPFTPREQLFLLRIVIAGVALFAFFFSCFFGQIDYILMFFTITGAIWLGGAGPCIVFGLYWKRGTTLAAYLSLIAGSILAVSGFVGQKTWVNYIYPYLERTQMVDTWSSIAGFVSRPFNPYIMWEVTPDKFPINSKEIHLIAMVTSLALYIGISLCSRKKEFNMDAMLHRGKYHLACDGEALVAEKWSFRTAFKKLIGIDSQYNIKDKCLAWGVFVWSFVWGFGSFIFAVIWNIFEPWSNEAWSTWAWIQSIVLSGIVGFIATIWFSIGGISDLRKLFDRLKSRDVENVNDDGRVIDHMSVADQK